MNSLADSIRHLLSRRLYTLSFYLVGVAVLSCALEVASLHHIPFRMAVWVTAVLVLPLNFSWYAILLLIKRAIKAVIRFLIEWMVEALRVMEPPLQSKVVKFSLAGAALAVLGAAGMILAVGTSTFALIESHAGTSPTLATNGIEVVFEVLTLLTAVATPLGVWWVFSSLREFEPRHAPGVPAWKYQERIYTYAAETLEDVAHDKAIQLVHSATGS